MSVQTAQLLVYRFGPDAKFEGGLVGALERIEAGAAVKIVDGLFVARDAETGELVAIDLGSHGAGASSARWSASGSSLRRDVEPRNERSPRMGAASRLRRSASSRTRWSRVRRSSRCCSSTPGPLLSTTR